MKGALIGKVYSCFFDHQVSVVTFLVQPYGVFVSNGTQGGGQVHKRSLNESFLLVLSASGPNVTDA